MGPMMFLLPLLTASSASGQLLHPSDNASVSDDVLSRRWPNGVIPYTVVLRDPGPYTESDFDSVRTWEARTQGAVRFVKRTTEDPYIEVRIQDASSRTFELRGIREADGTKISGARKIYVKPDGSWEVNHELGHVIGLWHQQRHYNSETCVTQKSETPPQLHPSKQIGHYSTDSIMHYRDWSGDFASWVNDPTMCPKPTASDTDPTDFDVRYVWKMYGVNGEFLNHTNWCSGNGQEVYMGDFNGDGLDDLLCHSKDGGEDPGYRFIDYAESNNAAVYGDGDWQNTEDEFCRLSHRFLYVGDFDGDGRDDLLCHDTRDGRRFIDHANGKGHLNGTDSRPDPHCAGIDKFLYVGDFDGDGMDDMLCHRKIVGDLSIDYAANGFSGEDWNSGSNVWCKKATRSIIVGDFDLDGRDDMVCHDLSDGHRWIDYANIEGHFDGSEWNSVNGGRPFCWGDNRTVYAADVDGDSRDDLICHNRRIGSIAVDFASSSDRKEGSQLTKANTFREISFCNAQDAHLLVGRLTKDSSSGLEPDSLFCHNRATGHQAARYDYD